MDNVIIKRVSNNKAVDKLTFGEYLRGLLTARNTNLSHLASEAGIKSKNEIYRVFENKCSYEKTKKLTEQILSVIKLGNEERHKLYELMEDCKISSSLKKSHSILEGLYRDTEKQRNNNIERIHKALKENKNSEITIFIGSEADIDISLFFDKFLTENRDYNISIIHSVNFNKSEEAIARELFNAIRLMPHNEYSLFEVSRSELKGVAGLISDAERCEMFLLTENSKFVQSSVSRELYEFLLERYSRCKKGKELKDTRDHLTDYAYTITKLTPIDKNNGFSFSGIFCFGDIPFEIMYRLLKDANYFGLPPDSPYITTIVSAAKKRYGSKSEVERVYVLSEERIRNFLSSGKTVDHVDTFRALTKEEMNIMADDFLTHKKGFKYRFFKQGYSNKCIECGIAENFGIVLCDASRGYGKKHFQTVISHPKAMSVFKSFTEYFWEKNTVSDKESKEKLNKLIKEYLN